MATTRPIALTLLAGLVGLLSAAVVMMARPVVGAAATVGISYVANNTGNSVTKYALGADGNMAPIGTISGAATGLSGPVGVALGAGGTLYVSNNDFGASNPSVTVYAAGANGNVAPIRKITGAATGLNGGSGRSLP